MPQRGLILHIDGIDGDCRHPRYGGWINVLWFSFGGSGEFGQNRPAHSASMTMFAGRISPRLQIACLRGDRFRSASFVALSPSGETERFHGAMEAVRVSGIQYQGEAMDQPIHSLELTYSIMEPKTQAAVMPSQSEGVTLPAVQLRHHDPDRCDGNVRGVGRR
jgi:type VI protein secretion system component Hcp